MQTVMSLGLVAAASDIKRATRSAKDYYDTAATLEPLKIHLMANGSLKKTCCASWTSVNREAKFLQRVRLACACRTFPTCGMVSPRQSRLPQTQSDRVVVFKVKEARPELFLTRGS